MFDSFIALKFGKNTDNDVINKLLIEMQMTYH